MAQPDTRIILVTSVTSSLALGISSGVSIYEAEALEEEKKLNDLEAAMLTNLENTSHFRSVKIKALLAAFIAFITPLVSCALAISPFILAVLRLLPIRLAAWTSISVALGVLFTVGAYMSRGNSGNPLLRGARMAAFGAGAFLLSIWMELMIG